MGTPGSLTVVSGVGQPRESHGSLWCWALQVVSRWSVGLGTPGSLTVVRGVGHSKKSHGSLWGWVTVVCGVGHSRESHGVCGVGHSQAVSGGSLSGRGVIADFKI